MKLPRPQPRYSPGAESQRNLQIEQADKRNRKKGTDVELSRGERVILQSPDGVRWAVTIDNTGTLQTEALT